jgi:hypothetical protein
LGKLRLFQQRFGPLFQAIHCWHSCRRRLVPFFFNGTYVPPFGTQAGQLPSSGRVVRIFNIAMAVLVFATLYPVLMDA